MYVVTEAFNLRKREFRRLEAEFNATMNELRRCRGTDEKSELLVRMRNTLSQVDALMLHARRGIRRQSAQSNPDILANCTSSLGNSLGIYITTCQARVRRGFIQDNWANVGFRDEK